MAENLAPEKRHSFFHGVFEWDQTLEEVNIYITLPPNVSTKLFYCKILSKHVEVGIKGNPPYLNHDLGSAVKTDSSFWTIEDDTLHITLQKRDKGQTWSSPIQGQGQLDPLAADLEQKHLMLQRFQEENPEFDFYRLNFRGTALIQGHSWAESSQTKGTFSIPPNMYIISHHFDPLINKMEVLVCQMLHHVI